MTRIELPEGAGPPLEVYLNGVRQQEGADYRVEPGAVVFAEPLEKEGRLGFWRWAAMALSLFGSYRRNDSVDVHYTRNGRREVGVDLPFEGPNLSADANRPDNR